MINRVARSGERIVLTANDKPKAALIGLEDYKNLPQSTTGERDENYWQEWFEELDVLNETILTRRQGQYINIDALWDSIKADQEDRDDQIIFWTADKRLANAARVDWMKLVG